MENIEVKGKHSKTQFNNTDDRRINAEIWMAGIIVRPKSRKVRSYITIELIKKMKENIESLNKKGLFDKLLPFKVSLSEWQTRWGSGAAIKWLILRVNKKKRKKRANIIYSILLTKEKERKMDIYLLCILTRPSSIFLDSLQKKRMSCVSAREWKIAKYTLKPRIKRKNLPRKHNVIQKRI